MEKWKEKGQKAEQMTEKEETEKKWGELKMREFESESFLC